MLGIKPRPVVADAGAWFDLRRICGRVAEHDLKGAIIMDSAPALFRSVLCLDVLEEVGAGHVLD